MSDIANVIPSLLIANRGEIAGRVIRTARELGIRTIAVHSSVDAGLPFVAAADEAVALEGPPPAVYRDTEQILRAAADTGAAAIHPGYGFLSENPDFADAVEQAGVRWVGPASSAIRTMGDKVAARAAMAEAGVPLPPGSPALASVEAAVEHAQRVGYPVMIKAAAGGGGMGMAVAENVEGLREQHEKVTGFAQRLFGDDTVFLERYFPRIRHIEVQVLGLADGTVLALGERDCSVQRRNQKVAEETPSPALTPQLRRQMCQAAVRAAQAVDYRGAGTVEFLFDPQAGAEETAFYFLEMNTRLQVEHPITEAVYGVDLVAEQLRVAAGLEAGFDPAALAPDGHAIELRINAEDPKRFLPGPGAITEWVQPNGPGVRVDAGYGPGTTVSPNYDSLMAKLIVHASDRDEAIERAKKAVAGFAITGPKSILPFHADLLESAEFGSGDYDTGIVGRLRG